MTAVLERPATIVTPAGPGWDDAFQEPTPASVWQHGGGEPDRR